MGPGGLNKDGQRIAPSVAPGDKVLIPQVGFLGTESCAIQATKTIYCH